MHRIKTVVLAAGALLAVIGSALVGPAAAGGGSQNEIIVDKVVVGPVPAGAVFEVDVACLAANADDPTPMVTTLNFDETGAPIGDNNVVISAFSATCTVTESVTNGATVSYTCAATFSPVDAAPAVDLQSATCTDDQTVEFLNVDFADGTVTVTNTYDDVASDDVAADNVATAPADVVAAQPTFTG